MRNPLFQAFTKLSILKSITFAPWCEKIQCAASVIFPKKMAPSSNNVSKISRFSGLTDTTKRECDSEKRIAGVESAMGRLDQTVHKELFALAREVAELKGRDEKNRTA